MGVIVRSDEPPGCPTRGKFFGLPDRWLDDRDDPAVTVFVGRNTADWFVSEAFAGWRSFIRVDRPATVSEVRPPGPA